METHFTPISPDDPSLKKEAQAELPGIYIKVINNLIKDKFNSKYAEFSVHQIIQHHRQLNGFVDAEEPSLRVKETDDHQFCSIRLWAKEIIETFTKVGWNVIFTCPRDNDFYSGTFRFEKK